MNINKKALLVKVCREAIDYFNTIINILEEREVSSVSNTTKDQVLDQKIEPTEKVV